MDWIKIEKDGKRPDYNDTIVVFGMNKGGSPSIERATYDKQTDEFTLMDHWVSYMGTMQEYLMYWKVIEEPSLETFFNDFPEFYKTAEKCQPWRSVIHKKSGDKK